MTNVRRIGLIVPSSNTTMETELPAILQRHRAGASNTQFTFHASRMRMREVTPAALAAMNAEIDRAVAELADLGPDLVATACLVAIMAQGAGAHEATEERIRTVLSHEDTTAPVVSSAGALINALQHLGARRIALIAPYSDELTACVAGYIEASGVTVQDSLSLRVTDNRAVAALDPMDLCQLWRQLDVDGCDALVVSACVQMQSLAAIPHVEQACGIPTLSAATATAWDILRMLDLEPTIPGVGALLAEHAIQPKSAA